MGTEIAKTGNKRLECVSTISSNKIVEVQFKVIVGGWVVETTTDFDQAKLIFNRY